MTLINRTIKGSPLTFQELDGNFDYLNNITTGNTQALTGKVDLVDGKIPTNFLYDQTLSSNLLTTGSAPNDTLDLNITGVTAAIITQQAFINAVNNLIAAATLLPGVAPTNFVFDDTNKTAGFTLPSGKALSDIQYTQNGGTTFVPVTANPMAVTVLPNAINKVGFRTAADSTHAASIILYNQTAYTAAPVVGLTPVTNFANTENVTIASNTVNYTVTKADGASAYTISQKKVPAGQPFVFEMDAPASTASGTFGVITQTTVSPNYITPMFIQWNYSSSTNGRFFGSYLDTNNAAQGFDDYTNVNFTGTAKGRLIGTGTIINAQQSYDNGVTWTNIADAPNLPQPNVDLYLQVIFNDVAPLSVVNIQESGMVAG